MSPIVQRIVQEATQTQAAIYPLGGETSLDYGIKGTIAGPRHLAQKNGSRHRLPSTRYDNYR